MTLASLKIAKQTNKRTKQTNKHTKYLHKPQLPLLYRENIIATAGATQGLHVISHLLFSTGDIVFVENPTYFVATKIFLTDAGFKVKSGKASY